MSSGGIQGNQQLSESAHGHIEAANGLLGSLNPTKPELPATDGANHAVDRSCLCGLQINGFLGFFVFFFIFSSKY